jgi:hypothetical protein
MGVVVTEEAVRRGWGVVVLEIKISRIFIK